MANYTDMMSIMFYRVYSDGRPPEFLSGFTKPKTGATANAKKVAGNRKKTHYPKAKVGGTLEI